MIQEIVVHRKEILAKKLAKSFEHIAKVADNRKISQDRLTRLRNIVQIDDKQDEYTDPEYEHE